MPRYDPVTDYLMHYGRKGMKWHKHIFGNDKQEPQERFEKTKTRYGHIPHADMTIGSISYNGENVSAQLDRERGISVLYISGRMDKSKQRVNPHEVSKRNKERASAANKARDADRKRRKERASSSYHARSSARDVEAKRNYERGSSKERNRIPMMTNRYSVRSKFDSNSKLRWHR